MRLLPAPLIPTLLSPRVNHAQVRRLLRLGIILRWVAIAFAGLAGVLAPKPPPLRFSLMVATLLYQLAVLPRASEATADEAWRLAGSHPGVDPRFDRAFIAG